MLTVKEPKETYITALKLIDPNFSDSDSYIFRLVVKKPHLIEYIEPINISAFDLRRLFQDNEKIMSHAKKISLIWEHMTGGEWCLLLRENIVSKRLCTKYDGWRRLTGSEWFFLLAKNPEFADICTKFGGWDKMDTHEKNILKGIVVWVK